MRMLTWLVLATCISNVAFAEVPSPADPPAVEQARTPEERESYARVLIKTGRYADATAVLDALIQSTPAAAPVHLRAHTLKLEIADEPRGGATVVQRTLDVEHAKQRARLVHDLRRPEGFAWSGFAASVLGIAMLVASVPLQHLVTASPLHDRSAVAYSAAFGAGGGVLLGLAGLLADFHQPFAPVLATLGGTIVVFFALLATVSPFFAAPFALAALGGGVIFNGLRWEFAQRAYADEARLALDLFDAGH